MRIIRFDSVGGASGDMILGALAGLGADLNAMEAALRSFIPEPFHFETETRQSCALSGLMLSVILDAETSEADCRSDHHHSHQNDSHDDCLHGKNHSHDHAADGHHDEGASGHLHGHDHHHDDRGNDHHHSHRSFADIKRMIEASSLPDAVKIDAIAVFTALAQAEGEIHGKAPEEVTFHEVGATDSIVDLVGAVIGFHQLRVDGISVSPIPIGSGNVVCAHGVYPIPAPATAALLRQFRLPVSLNGEECEMLTPTGAVLLGFWKKIPASALREAAIIQTAHSLGHHEMKTRPNLLRATLYETFDGPSFETFSPTDVQTAASVAGDFNADGEKSESLTQFEANIDDVGGEIMSAAAKKLFALGALDVWFTPILMKKGRPGHLLGVLTTPESREIILHEIFRQTGTFGVREENVLRHALARRWETVETRFGPIRIKIGSRGGVDLHFSPEFDDCEKAAETSGVAVMEVYHEAVTAIRHEKGIMRSHHE